MSDPISAHLVEKKIPLCYLVTWIIHESRLPQMQGAAHEAVVVHREWAATQQMRQDRLARRVKNADYD